MKMAWQIIGQVKEEHPEKVAALHQTIRQDNYHIDHAKVSAALLDTGDLGLAALMSRHPSLISEYVSLYGRNTTRDLLRILQTHDGFTGQHSIRVTAMALGFARYLGLSAVALEPLQRAGYFHDIGKAEITQAVLLRRGALTTADRRIIETHPLNGVKVVRLLALGPQEQEIILHHHEYWDGQGYPFGLAGEQIPFLSRLVSLADAFEALTHNRPHRHRFPVHQALGIIRARAGTQFDPSLTAKFIEMISLENMAGGLVS